LLPPRPLDFPPVLSYRRRSTPTVLVVDEEPRMRRVLGRVAEQTFNATVLETGDTDDAMRLLREHPVDLLITEHDHHVNGIALMEFLRGDPRLRSVPVLVATTGVIHPVRDAWKAGANDVLRKPFHLEELARVMGDLLKTTTRLPEPEIGLIELGTEMQTLDYKGTLLLRTDKQCAAFAKDVIAFANIGGGTIIVGVEEPAPGRFTPMGVSEEQQATLETTRLCNAVKAWVDPPAALVSRRVRHQERDFVFIDVPTGGTELVMAARDHPDAGLHRARIYGRTVGAESAPLDSSAEIRAVIERIVEARMRARAH